MNKTDISRRTHNIAVDNCNYESLKNMGKTGDSFNSVVTRLIKITAEGASTVSSQRERNPLASFNGSIIVPLGRRDRYIR